MLHLSDFGDTFTYDYFILKVFDKKIQINCFYKEFDKFWSLRVFFSNNFFF